MVFGIPRIVRNGNAILNCGRVLYTLLPVSACLVKCPAYVQHNVTVYTVCDGVRLALA